jgi:hypothetical protein
MIRLMNPRVGAGLDGGLGARPALFETTAASRAGRATTLPSRPAPTLSKFGDSWLVTA